MTGIATWLTFVLPSSFLLSAQIQLGIAPCRPQTLHVVPAQDLGPCGSATSRALSFHCSALSVFLLLEHHVLCETFPSTCSLPGTCSPIKTDRCIHVTVLSLRPCTSWGVEMCLFISGTQLLAHLLLVSRWWMIQWSLDEFRYLSRWMTLTLAIFWEFLYGTMRKEMGETEFCSVELAFMVLAFHGIFSLPISGPQKCKM